MLYEEQQESSSVMDKANSKLIDANTIPVIVSGVTSEHKIDSNEIIVGQYDTHNAYVNSIVYVSDGNLLVDPISAQKITETLQAVHEPFPNYYATFTPFTAMAKVFHLTKETGMYLLNKLELIQSLPLKTQYQLYTVAGIEVPERLSAALDSTNLPMTITYRWPNLGKLIPGEELRARALNIMSKYQILPVIKGPQRSRIHEMEHYLVAADMQDGIPFTRLKPILDNITNIFTTRIKNDNTEHLKEFYSLTASQISLVGVSEANAILHDVLGEQVIATTDNFIYEAFEFRILQLLDSMKVSSLAENSILFNCIQSSLNNSDTIIESYITGTLLLLFGKNILSENPEKLIDFSKLLNDVNSDISDEDKTNLILAKIYQRIVEVDTDPKIFAQDLIDRDFNLVLHKLYSKAKLQLLTKVITLFKAVPEIVPQDFNLEDWEQPLQTF